MTKIQGPSPDPYAERGVLAGICQYHSDAYFDIIDIVKPESFSEEANVNIFKCLQHLFSKDNAAKADYLTIVSSANEIGLKPFFENSEEQKYLKAILNSTVKYENIRSNAIKIRKLHLARQIVGQLHESIHNVATINGTETFQHILSLAENPIFNLPELIEDKTTSSIKLGDGVTEYVQHLIDNPVAMLGIPTGYLGYDKAIGGGLMRGEIDVIAARLKVGKSQLVDNIGLYITKNLNIPVLNIDTEMSRREHWHRILANLASVEIDDITTGRFGKREDEKEKVIAAAEILKSIPYHYESVSGLSHEDILSVIRRWIVKEVGFDENGNTKPAVVIFDYFKTMNSDEINDSMKEYQLLGFKLMSLKDLCKKFDIACLAFAQTNREGIAKEDSSTIGDSDRIGRYASSLTLLKEKSDEEIEMDGPKSGNRKLVTLVARNGPAMEYKDYLNIIFEGKYGRMTEGKTHFELQRDKKDREGFEAEEDVPSI